MLPDLVAGRPASLDGGPPVAIAPGATMPSLLIAGDARPALRRAATFGDGLLAIGLSPWAVATQQVILPPTGTDWRAGYEFAAAVRAACR